MDDKTIYDVVKRLVGSIEPYGASHIDNDRYNNLETHIAVVYLLLRDIQDTAMFKDRHEHSMNVMGKKADNFMKTLPYEFCITNE